MEKLKKMQILSALLDELTQSIWRDCVMCWALSGDEGEDLLLTLDIYESYTISQRWLTDLVVKLGVASYDISYLCVKGALEIRISLSMIKTSE